MLGGQPALELGFHLPMPISLLPFRIRVLIKKKAGLKYCNHVISGGATTGLPL